MLRDRFNEKTAPMKKKLILFYHLDGVEKAKHWQRFEEVSLVFGWISNPTGVLSSFYCFYGFCNIRYSWMGIYNNFSTIFRTWTLFSGFAMVETLLIIMRKVVNMEIHITIKHIEYMNIIILLTGSLVGTIHN